MGSLREKLLDPARRGAVVDDCVRLIDREVEGKSGLGGLAIKGAYGVVRRLKPGIIRDAADHLLEPFVTQLEPTYAAYLAQSSLALEPYLVGRAAEIANALLGVTDARAARSANATLRKTYDKLRPSALKHVEAAVPGIARLLAKYS